MKYLTKELYTMSYCGNNYNDNEDKFLIGYLNNAGNKLKDVTTGQIVESDYFAPITHLASLNNQAVSNMALGYMTGLRANEATIYQSLLARYIDSVVKKESIDTKQIERIKQIINKGIVTNHNKQLKKQQRLIKKQIDLQQYSVKESEKEF
ncbi:MAG: hypothetical protein IJW59_02080 [Clostridia bacterium]|nr:hypothetical protein [Clostridia bacterium]